MQRILMQEIESIDQEQIAYEHLKKHSEICYQVYGGDRYCSDGLCLSGGEQLYQLGGQPGLFKWFYQHQPSLDADHVWHGADPEALRFPGGVFTARGYSDG